MASAVTATPVSRGRLLAYRITAGVLGVGLGLPAFGLIALVLPWFSTGERLVHRVHDLGWGVAGGLMLALPLIIQAIRPHLIAVFQILIASAVTAILVVVPSRDVWAWTAIVPVVVAVLAWLHPDRRLLLSRGRFSWVLAVLAAAAAIPLAVYAVDMGRLQATGHPADPHIVEHHWSSMATIAIVLPLVGIVAAMRSRGWRITAGIAAGAAVFMGAAWIAFPGDPGSAGRVAGWAMVAGGVVFAAASAWEARRPE